MMSFPPREEINKFKILSYGTDVVFENKLLFRPFKCLILRTPQNHSGFLKWFLWLSIPSQLSLLWDTSEKGLFTFKIV